MNHIKVGSVNLLDPDPSTCVAALLHEPDPASQPVHWPLAHCNQVGWMDAHQQTQHGGSRLHRRKLGG